MNNKFANILLVLIIGFSIAMRISMWRFTIDDSFITYRYSRHFADGYGIVWNKGESPVEGYSNFLLVIMLSVFIKLGLDPVVCSKVIGIIMLGGTGIMGYLLGLKLLNRKNPFLALVPVLIFSSNPKLVIHAVSGLETVMFCFILLTLTYLALKAMEHPQKSILILLYSLFFVSGLIRPEGVLFSAVLFIVLILINKEIRKSNSIRLFLLCFIIPGIIYMLWKINYFGYIFPNTYYLKGYSDNLFIGLNYVASFILVVNLIFMLSLLILRVPSS